MKKYLLALLLILFSANAWAACSGTSPNLTAASASYDDVSACVTASTYGDTINVPAGTATWSSTLLIHKGITLKGAGAGNTNITRSGYAITYNPDSTSAGNNDGTDYRFEVSGFTIIGGGILLGDNENDGGYTTTTKAKTKIVIGNNVFQSSRVYVKGTFWGVIYKNTWTGASSDFVGVGGGGTTGVNAFSGDLNYGTYKTMYIEDNTISIDSGTETFIETGTGGRWVLRYNVTSGSVKVGFPLLDQHGCQDSGNPGNVLNETYGNLFTFINTATWNYQRGGKVLMFNNINSMPSSYGKIWQQLLFDPAVYCSGVNNYAAILPPNNSYFFNNFANSTLQNCIEEGDTYNFITENSSFWNYNASCTASSCSAGVGTGSATPTGTCTKGVAYWKTSYSPSSSAPTTMEDMKTYTQAGTLYKCVSNNTWAEYYKPYTYPHPLRDDGGSDTTDPTFSTSSINAAGTTLSITLTEDVTVNTNTGFTLHGCSGGAANLTYVSEASGVLSYTIARAIQQSETGCHLDYTTGADYIEDAAGNDLDTFADRTVVNNSTQNTPPTVTLTISSHIGATAIATPSGTDATINCGSTCSASYDNGTSVVVQGSCLANYQNMVIGGDCTAETGAVSMTEARSCTVTCTKIAADNKVGAGNPGHRVGAGNPAHKRY